MSTKVMNGTAPMVLQTMLDEARREIAEAQARIEHQEATIRSLESRLKRHPWNDVIRELENDNIRQPVKTKG